MKKIFTLIAAAFLAASVNAQTLINYAGEDAVTAGIEISGTTAMASQKINTNTTSKNCIQLKNGYTSDNVFNNNAIILSTEGGFKAGDVLSVTGFFNNSDDTKKAAVEIFTINADNTCTAVWTSEKFINGKLVADDPVAQTYTLESDMEKIYIGRSGNTGTNIMALSVVRGGSTAIKNVNAASSAKTVKAIENGQLVIKSAKGTFNAAGAQMK